MKNKREDINKKKLKIKILLIVPILLIIYVYGLAIEKIPNEYILFEGETIKVNSSLGIKIQDSKVDDNKLTVSIFNNIPIKEIDVSLVSKSSVIPIGELVGLKLYTEGALVVGMAEIDGIKPYKNTDIEIGDSIISINGNDIETANELIDVVNRSNGSDLEIVYIKEGIKNTCTITPIRTISGEYKIGLWVRDSAAGVGTLTYYDPQTNVIGALGHGISDIDIGDIINISDGQFVTTKIANIVKGQNNLPGKIQGSINDSLVVGTITKNTEYGLYGKLEEQDNIEINYDMQMEVAQRDEIQEGKATLLCDVDKTGVKGYEIEITKVYRDNMHNNKSMQIEITDKDLIEKTGGIIQGMSGAPIVQNGKFVGAVTYVLVNNSCRGYAVFGEMMIKEASKN